MSDTLKTLVIHFTDGEILPIEVENYTFGFDVTGLYLREETHEKLAVLTTEKKYRTMLFINMATIKRVEYKYFD